MVRPLLPMEESCSPIPKPVWYTATQPLCIPAIYIVHRWAMVDHIVLMGEAQYSRTLPVNWTVLADRSCREFRATIPMTGSRRGPIRDMVFRDFHDWRKKFERQLEATYAKAPGFPEVFHSLSTVLRDQPENVPVEDFAVAMYDWLKRLLGFHARLHHSHALVSRAVGNPTQWLADMGVPLYATDYTQGGWTIRNYFERGTFQGEGIRVWEQNFSMPPFGPDCTDRSRGGIEFLSILDPLFWLGVEGTRTLVGANRKRSQNDFVLWEGV